MLRLEVGTESAWVLAGSTAVEYAVVNEHLGYLAERKYSHRPGLQLRPARVCRWLDAEGITLDSVTWS